MKFKKTNISVYLISIAWLLPISIIIDTAVRSLGVRPQLQFNADTWGYLEPAVSALSEGPFNSVYARTFIYPGFLYVVLGIGNSARAIFYTQGALFLATGLMILFIPLISVRCRANGTSRPVIIVFVSTFFLYLFYSDPSMVYVSRYIGPECLYTFLTTTVAILVVLSFRLSSVRALIFVCTTGLYVTVLNFYVKPAWAAAMALTGIYFLGRIWLINSYTKLFRVTIIGFMLGLITLTLVWPQHYLTRTYDALTGATFGPQTFVCNHAPIVLTELKRRLVEGIDVEQRPILVALRDSLSEVIHDGPSGWPLLGFNGDRCFYRSQAIAAIYKYFQNQPERISAFFMNLFVDAVAGAPKKYTGTVLKQMRAVISVPLTDIDTHFAWSYEPFDPGFERFSAFNRLFSETELFSGTATGPMSSIVGTSALRALNHLFWIPLLLAVIGPIASLCRARGRYRENLYRWGPVTGLAVLFVAAVGIVAVAHTFDIGRYRWPLFPLVLTLTGTVIVTTLMSDGLANTARIAFACFKAVILRGAQGKAGAD